MSNTIAMEAAPLSEVVRKNRYELADNLEKVMAADLPWHKFETPAAYRQARADGSNGFKKPLRNDKATIITCSARDSHPIELRIIEPTSAKSKGVFLHFHAG